SAAYRPGHHFHCRRRGRLSPVVLHLALVDRPQAPDPHRRGKRRGGGGTTASAPVPASARLDWLLVGFALLASVVLLWFITGDPVVVATFGGGLLVLGGVAASLARQ